MNMGRPAAIPAGIDCRKLDNAVVVGKLGAAHEGFSAGVHTAIVALTGIAGVNARGIAVPDVDTGARHG